jgi:hypothetical protein
MRGWQIVAIAVAVAGIAHAQQVSDPDFDTKVQDPAYALDGPRVAIDEAHRNFHTMAANYRPFAQLLAADGYRVRPSTAPFSAESLANVDVLVVANAVATKAGESAFTDAECDALRDWVRAGGSLLLIADHAPFGSATADLARRFGVEMGQGYVYERQDGRITTQLVFSRANGRLGAHPLLEGRVETERVKLVRAFTGQSLSAPAGAVVLLRLGPTAREAAGTDELNRVAATKPEDPPPAGTKSAAGRAQGLAMSVGKGRIVVLGEAAMLSAQVATVEGPQGKMQIKAGMNVPGTDDRQFALNLMHWLSGAIP